MYRTDNWLCYTTKEHEVPTINPRKNVREKVELIVHLVGYDANMLFHSASPQVPICVALSHPFAFRGSFWH